MNKARTAVVITDPQNDFLREDGKLYRLLADNLREVGVIGNIERLMKSAKEGGVVLAVDPLVYTALDRGWTNSGTLQRQLLGMQALHTTSLAESAGFEGMTAPAMDRPCFVSSLLIDPDFICEVNTPCTIMSKGLRPSAACWAKTALRRSSSAFAL